MGDTPFSKDLEGKVGLKMNFQGKGYVETLYKKWTIND